MVKTGAVFCAALLAAVSVSPVVAETNAAVPLELVLGILGAEGDQLFLGTLPDALSRVVPVPDGSIIVGGIEREASTSIVLVLPTPATEVHSDYGDLLSSRGWSRLAPASSSMGFVTPDTNEERFYCGPAASMLGVHAAASSEGSSRLTLSYSPSTRYGPCAAPAEDRTETAELAMPILRVPDGVTWGSSTTCSTHSEAAGEAVRLTGVEQISDMVEHFGEQLVGQGWLLEDQAVGEEIGLQYWSREDEGGQPWNGTLSVLSVGADDSGQGVVEASFQVVGGPGR